MISEMFSFAQPMSAMLRYLVVRTGNLTDLFVSDRVLVTVSCIVY